MKIETKAKLIAAALVGMFLYSVFARLAYGGAPIPAKPAGYYYPPSVRNDCLLTYRADKSMRCDRVFRSSFQ